MAISYTATTIVFPEWARSIQINLNKSEFDGEKFDDKYERLKLLRRHNYFIETKEILHNYATNTRIYFGIVKEIYLIDAAAAVVYLSLQLKQSIRINL